MSLLPLRALVRKDIRLFLSDRRAVILSFAVPIVLASFFAVITGGAGAGGGGESAKIPILVVDDDESAVSKAIVQGLEGDEHLAVGRSALGPAREQVRKGKVGVAVAIPKGFGGSAAKAMFRAAKRPKLAFYYDPTHAAEFAMVRGLMTQHVMESVSRDAFGGAGSAEALRAAEARIDEEGGMPAELRATLKNLFSSLDRVREQTKAAGDAPGDREAEGFGGLGAPFDTQEEKVMASGQVQAGAAAAHAFAGMGVQFILFASVEAGVALLLERRLGLWRRLRAAPIGRQTILGSKAISQALIGLIITAVVFGFGIAAFHVRFSGSLLGFLLVAAAYALASSTFGLLIAAVGKTPEAARGVSILVVLLMVLLGGAWIPLNFFPAWLQSVTPFIPTRWAVDGFEGATWRGLGLAPLLVDAAALLGFAAVFGGLAVARFRWEED